MDIKNSLIKARIQLILDKPFYGNLALHLPLEEDNSVPTFATDGKKIYYNKKFAESLSERDHQFILCHELLHCVFHHNTRIGERNYEKWSLAIDYATNSVLEQDFGYVPKGGAYSEKFNNMTAETIYNKLPDMNGKCKGNENYKRYSNKEMTVEIDKDGEMKVDGNPIKKYDEHKEADGSKQEKDELEKEWTIQVAKAYQQAKIAGSLPAGMKIFIESLLEPKLDWRNMMKQYIISNSKSDFQWYPCNRRFIHQDMYMPSMTGESLGDVAFIIDNSGSTLSDQQRFFSECNGLLQQYEMNLHLIVVDTRINSYKIYNQGDTIDLNQRGGGGTDLKKAWDFIDEKMINPSVVICLTDGYTDLNFSSKYPTLWVLCKDSVELEKIPFGIKVKMNEN